MVFTYVIHLEQMFSLLLSPFTKNIWEKNENTINMHVYPINLNKLALKLILDLFSHFLQ